MKKTCGIKEGCGHGSKVKNGKVVSGPCKNFGGCLEAEREQQHYRRKEGMEKPDGSVRKGYKPFVPINHSVIMVLSNGAVIDIGS